jgi:hypothetical protein
VIHEHGEPWWNDVDRGKFLIRPPEFSGNPTTSRLVAKQEEQPKEMTDFALRIILSYSVGFFSMP